MKNINNIQISDIEKYWRPEIWDGCDHETNLSDQHIGYYAYILQNRLLSREKDDLYRILQYKEICNGFLSEIHCDLTDVEITEKTFTLDFGEKEELAKMQSLNKEELAEQYCSLEAANKIIDRLKNCIENPRLEHNFEFSFMAWIGGVGHPIVIRNGYLLKCLGNAEIKSFDEIDKYKAHLIYNHLQVNAKPCAFVQFEKKH